MSAAPTSLRVAVVGAGIVGTSCAWFLARDGHAVTLVDPRPPGSGTSSGNAGIISVTSVLPIVTLDVLRKLPKLLTDPVSPLTLRWRHLPSLAPWLLRAAIAARPARAQATSRAIQALASRAVRAHEVLIQEIGAGDLFTSRGWLKLGLDVEAFMHGTAADRTLLDHFGIPYRLLDWSEVHSLEPAIGPEVKAGLLLEANREIRHPQAYVERIAAAFLAMGGVHRASPAKGLAIESGRVVGLLTTEGTIAADRVVVAAGAFSGRLASAAGCDLPLEAERGYHLMLPAPEPGLGRPIYCAEPGFVLAPMQHGLRLTSGVELSDLDAPPDFSIPRRLLPHARRYLPSLDDRVVSEWQGFRPSLPDSLPVIGPAPRHPEVVLAFGHQHIGLTLGPLTGRIVADLVAGRDPGIDLVPYRPDRRFF